MDERVKEFWLGAVYEDSLVVGKLIREDVNCVILQVNEFIKLGTTVHEPIKRIYRVP